MAEEKVKLNKDGFVPGALLTPKQQKELQLKKKKALAGKKA